MFSSIPLSDRRLKRIAFICLATMTCIQICLIVKCWDIPQFSDYGEYARLAYRAFDEDSWYPTEGQLYGLFIFAPGFVNWLCLQLHAFGTLSYNPIFNMLMNLGIMGMMFTIARKYFSNRTAWISIILYSMLYSTWWSVVPMATEIPFLFCSLGAVCLSLSRKWLLSLPAGLIFALANSIRPLAVLFVVTAIFLVIARYRRSRNVQIWLRSSSIAIGITFGIICIGNFSKESSGRFICQSSTSGINLVYTANDEAYGGVAASLLSKPGNACHIENMGELLYSQKDSIWRHRAVKWIKENPGKYASFFLWKIPGMFVEDSWPDRAVHQTSGSVDAFFHNEKSAPEFISYAISVILKSLVYYIVLLLFIKSLWIRRKEIWSVRGIWLLLLASGVAATCLFAVSPRYHYPYMFVIVMWAAYSFRQHPNGSQATAC